jgi:hypothetical protein
LFAKLIAVSAIFLVITLAGSLAIAAVTRYDPIAYVIFQVLLRLFELFYCLLVIITFWNALKKQPSKPTTSQTDAQNSQSQTHSKPSEREISSQL